jgi:hypothetical protein
MNESVFVLLFPSCVSALTRISIWQTPSDLKAIQAHGLVKIQWPSKLFLGCTMLGTAPTCSGFSLVGPAIEDAGFCTYHAVMKVTELDHPVLGSCDN